MFIVLVYNSKVSLSGLTLKLLNNLPPSLLREIHKDTICWLSEDCLQQSDADSLSALISTTNQCRKGFSENKSQIKLKLTKICNIYKIMKLGHEEKCVFKKKKKKRVHEAHVDVNTLRG